MIDTFGITNKVAELRKAFDGTFALPPPARMDAEFESLLAIRVAGDPYALVLREISGLVNGRTAVPFPSPIQELLGVAGIRGRLVPVYSLASLLGYAANREMPRWIVVCAPEDSMALSFSTFEGYLRTDATNIHAAQKANNGRDHVTQVVRTGASIRAVVSILSIVQAIQKRVGEAQVSKER